MPIDTFLAERTATSHANGLPVLDSALSHVLRGAKGLDMKSRGFNVEPGNPRKRRGVLPA
ncbi:hypothetical protein BCEN4_310033 [Burkholderia cenocepacia]|uniref:hypothetical protein n=1 Tax=Burkholderia cenocepacia TaxID=95486 RepID=UPI00192C975B|nr:hypothetical protein [Burkholderia cenocepacia]CAD9223039.1 hypothetical protein BCEN4_310033 [Burkholderia cenocepacia]